MAMGNLPLWKEAPFIRVLLPFTGGIIIARYIPDDLSETPVIYILIFLTALLLLYPFLTLTRQFEFRFYPGIIFTLLLTLSGIHLYQNSRAASDPGWAGYRFPAAEALLIVINEPLQEKSKSFKSLATIESIIINDSLIPVNGKLLIYFRKDSVPVSYQYGDRLLIKPIVQTIKSSKNPGSFDYASYSQLQGIYHQVFLKQGDHILIDSNHISFLRKLMFDTREKIISILKKNIPGEKERGLAEALLIGYKDDLDKELLQSYSNTGVVHVIAISGLHLGLIYFLLTVLCRILPFKNKFIQGLIIIAGLWIFSALAGGSPSVLRSATMFSFIVIGGWMKRKPPSINSLAASAFLLLCIEPSWLWDTGFQLSYTAVFGLMVLSKPVYRLFYLKNPLLDNLWKMSSVTIAATILTFPLTIYYFNQFPNYFIITNLFVIPLSSLILMLELLLCAISFITLPAEITGRITEKLIMLMNDFVAYSETIPGSSSTNLKIEFVQVILVYIFILLFYKAVEFRSRSYLKWAVSLLFIIFSFRLISIYQSSRQEILVVYNAGKYLAMDIIKGRNSKLFSDGELLNDKDALKYNIHPSRIYYRIKNIQNKPLEPGTFSGIEAGSDKITIINKTTNLSGEVEKTEILIISGNPIFSPDEIITARSPELIILASSNHITTRRKWIESASKHAVSCYDIAEEGAFIKAY